MLDAAAETTSRTRVTVSPISSRSFSAGMTTDIIACVPLRSPIGRKFPGRGIGQARRRNQPFVEQRDLRVDCLVVKRAMTHGAIGQPAKTADRIK